MPGRWKAWKTKNQVSHSFPRPLEISHTPRDFHISTAITTILLSPFQTQRKEVGPLRGLLIWTLFQDHLVLETLPTFKIILGLENAD
jgi:hypothetical protein